MKKLNKIIILLLCLLLTSTNIMSNETKIINTKSNETLLATSNKKTLKNIVVFIEFNDSETLVTNHLDDEQSVQNAYTIFNSEDLFEMDTKFGKVKVPSFKKYYERESYGDLSITSEIFPKENNKVVSYKDIHPIGYYLKYSDQNTTGYKDKEESLKRETELINNATNYISNMVSAYGITSEELDVNKDNKIDAISFIVEVPSVLPSSIAWNDLLWSHKLDNDGVTATILGKRASSYTLIKAEDYTQMAGLFSLNTGTYGTIIHEFGHTLGFMDLYRYDSSTSRPVGFYDIMGQTIGSNPQSFLTYYISEYNNNSSWHSPLPVITESTNNITVNKPNYIDRTEQRAIKIQRNKTDKEFFVVEYHEKLNTYETHSADESGIIIYRVNENNKYLGATDGSNQGKNDHVFIFRPNETGLGEGLGNLREATLNMNRPTFGSDITNDKSFDNKSIYYTDGSNSGIKIEVTSQTDSSVTFNIIFPKTEGEGTKDKPYIINDANEFLYHMSLDTKNKYYKIVSDLDFKDIKDYPKIDFDGNLDGNNQTIKNITTNGSGIFNNININNYQTQTTIENLNFENISIYSKTGNYLGGLSSSATNAVLKNIRLKSGTVNNDGPLMNDIASTGGFLGNVDNTTIIEDCYSNLDVTAQKNVGGFIGINMNAKIKNSFSNGKVTGSQNTGSFIGLQAITDNTYNTPTNVYFNKNMTKNLPAVGGYASSFHNLNTLNENSLSNGIKSIETKEKITINKNSLADFIVTINPQATLSYTVTIENIDIATYENNKILGINPGTSKIFTNIKIGNNNMQITTNLTVNDKEGALTEKEVLELLSLSKKENYLIGFTLGMKVQELKNKIQSTPTVTYKSLTNDKSIEITEGIISTGMKLCLSINNIDYNYIIVIKGDVNGDGMIYATDYVKVKNHIMGKSHITGPYLEAADINNDGKIYATDYVLIKNHIMGKKPIEQSV